MKQEETVCRACAAKVTTELDPEQRCAKIRICGEIDHHSAKYIREQMDGVIARHHPLQVRMLLHEVNFMDSSGLGLMLGRYTRIREYGGRLILVDPTQEIMKILVLAGADKLFSIERSARDPFMTDQKQGGNPA